jgi:acetoacetyl-CoA synthetase
LWQPSEERIASARLTAFVREVKAHWGVDLHGYEALWRWSVAEREKFWQSVWEFCGVIAEREGPTVLADGDRLPGARWFPGARLNYAENLLRRTDDAPALIFRGEDKVRRTMSHGELRDLVSRIVQALEAEGIGLGDRVAGYLPNLPESIACFLACASIGAIWSSCSPDFGVTGIVDRFGQIEPKLLFAADGYHYNGKQHDTLARAAEVQAKIPGIRKIIVVPYLTAKPDGLTLDDFVAPFAARSIPFKRLPFDHPLYILYSSGTTGVPKCIVHQLHGDVKPNDRLFYFSTLGWMMWNWLVSGLASGATLLLYDGSPFYPNGNALWDFADESGITHFGTSAKYIDACKKAEIAPMRTHKLSGLRTIFSTGSPLAPESFDYVYARVKRDVCLSSVAGGTDIVSCFVGGNPTGPVWRGEIQVRGLGMDVRVFDESGRSLIGEKGELVCAAAFPSVPIGFWNDPGDRKFRAAYFERFPGVWHHGDWAEITSRGGAIIYGRSDAVLNPGGVRIGTAEIYRQVEQIDEVEEALAIGQDWDGDVRVILFVKLRPGAALDAALESRIKEQIRRNTTPRHVPARIVPVADIPRTKSGKIVELAVREVVHGRAVKNIEALANPEALAHFRDRAELRT